MDNRVTSPHHHWGSGWLLSRSTWCLGLWGGERWFFPTLLQGQEARGRAVD